MYYKLKCLVLHKFILGWTNSSDDTPVYRHIRIHISFSSSSQRLFVTFTCWSRSSWTSFTASKIFRTARVFLTICIQDSSSSKAYSICLRILSWQYSNGPMLVNAETLPVCVLMRFPFGIQQAYAVSLAQTTHLSPPRSPSLFLLFTFVFDSLRIYSSSKAHSKLWFHNLFLRLSQYNYYIHRYRLNMDQNCGEAQLMTVPKPSS